MKKQTSLISYDKWLIIDEIVLVLAPTLIWFNWVNVDVTVVDFPDLDLNVLVINQNISENRHVV